MSAPIEYSFQRYLEAKRSVDDRALNRLVWERLVVELQEREGVKVSRVLEIGAGIGTMFERLIDWGALRSVHYTAVDLNPQNIQTARQRLSAWGYRHGWQVSEEDWGLGFLRNTQQLELILQADDFYDFLKIELSGESRWDLLIAHAFLDLIDVPSTLPGLFSLLEGGGIYYFTVNFDGLTVFEPILDEALDKQVISLYHRSMNERIVAGCPSGSSLTGRKLFADLERYGSELLSAGASDWVVHPVGGRYPEDEAYFLHYIIHTVHQELSGHPEIDRNDFLTWIQKRHDQVERGELTYIAHQIDFLGWVS